MLEKTAIEDAAFDRAVAAFSRERGRYETLAEYVCKLVRDHCGDGLIHTTEHRAKTIESFDRKCRKLNDDGSLRYPQPLEQLTDLAGVRVIVFLRDSVNSVCDEINKFFEVVEQEDVGDRVYRQGKFGYQSKHLLIRLGEDRKHLIENLSIQNLICEIQVRTLLQHAWAEMEHDIQYKTEIDVPLDLNKRFSALAGLLEIADREFANIQRDSEELKLAVKEDLITDLTQQSLNKIQESSGDEPVDYPIADARELVSKGRYADAINIYSEKIMAEPNSYTLFLGRARALFLIGDVRSAVADLNQADTLSGDLEHTRRLRGIIERGDDPRKALPQQAPSKFAGERASASEAMQQGDGARAFDDYSRLEAAGFNKAFALFGKAMSCALQRDVQGARNFLGSLELRMGTPMSVNIRALESILAILSGEEVSVNLAQLERALEEVPEFELSRSSLNELQSGFKVKNFAEIDLIEAVFARLSKSI